ncbi:hypothetical protein ACHAWF_003492, partial [Thalassiosira exigua]
RAGPGLAEDDPLPIAARRTQILRAVELHGVVILVGETGCGKSTQLPRYLWENGWADVGPDEGSVRREIVCTQPRRLAATTLAGRVAAEVGNPDVVGYSVRFASTHRPGATKIRYVTDGWLLRELTLLDPLLRHVSVLIIDEAHERSANTELLLGAIKKIRRVRPELRVIVCSATLDAEAFLDFFVGRKRKRSGKEGDRKSGGEKLEEKGSSSAKGGDAHPKKRRKSRWGRVGGAATTEDGTRGDDEEEAAAPRLDEGTIISVDGRQHPVEVLYVREPASDYVKAAVETALRIHEREGDDGGGDVLCFLPTGEDVDEAVEMAEHVLASSSSSEPGTERGRGRGPGRRSAVCLPLYASLPPRLQSQPFLPKSDDERRNNARRIVFATNVAETSVTVPDVAQSLIAAGPRCRYTTRGPGSIGSSRASAKQRAGRAGRVRPGKCYRLYSEEDFRRNMEEDTAPEVLRSDPTTLIVTIKALGVRNVLSFDLMSVPSAEALSRALETLYALGALDEEGELTELGREMVYFPTDPRTSRMLLASLDAESREETPSVVAKLIAGDVLTVAAALQVRDLFRRPRTERQRRACDDAMADVLDRSGDHVTAVHLCDLVDHAGSLLSEDECRERFVDRTALKRVLDVRAQLARFVARRFGGGDDRFGPTRRELVGSRGFDAAERSEAIRRCVCAGYFANVAKLGSGGRYYTLRGNYAVAPSPSSVLHRYGESSEYILFGRTFDGNRGGVDAKPCSAISGLWLRELAPHYWT